MNQKIYTFLLILFPNFLLGADNHIHFTLNWVIPFIGLLLSIAIVPLINEHFWHKNFGKISAFWASLFSIPFITVYSSETLYYYTHAIILEYIPFIVLLFALFTISGGIVIRGNFVGTPRFNLSILVIGTLLASWMGTTGAAMLLIRPLIRANQFRVNKTHIIIFFIFLVANIGGSLTPLGDPPLFIGFLKGIDFFWTTKNMFLPMMFISLVLLILFYFIDNYYYNKESKSDKSNSEINFSIEGKFNFILLLGVIISVIFSGFYKDYLGYINIFNNEVKISFLLRDFMILLFGYLSYRLTDYSLRKDNGFSWFPIQEVGKLFAGIFVTVIPAISILGNYKSDFQQLSNISYFWLTGLLSGFLDNAPTYLVFFTSTGKSPEILMDASMLTLLAISSGAVFMGALTYIGNAPNFMVRSIAEENKIKMPSFFGFMAWSIPILIPIFLIYSYFIFG